jgi:hypothetical protein
MVAQLRYLDLPNESEDLFEVGGNRLYGFVSESVWTDVYTDDQRKMFLTARV